MAERANIARADKAQIIQRKEIMGRPHDRSATLSAHRLDLSQAKGEA